MSTCLCWGACVCVCTCERELRSCLLSWGIEEGGGLSCLEFSHCTPRPSLPPPSCPLGLLEPSLIRLSALPILLRPLLRGLAGGEKNQALSLRPLWGEGVGSQAERWLCIEGWTGPAVAGSDSTPPGAFPSASWACASSRMQCCHPQEMHRQDHWPVHRHRG